MTSPRTRSPSKRSSACSASIPNFYVSYISEPGSSGAEAEVSTGVEGLRRSGQLHCDWASSRGSAIAEHVWQDTDKAHKAMQSATAPPMPTASIGTMISNAMLPVLFKQDPAVLLSGDCSISIAALSTPLRVPCSARAIMGTGRRTTPTLLETSRPAASPTSTIHRQTAMGLSMTFEDTLIGLAAGAGGNLFQEFLIRRICPVSTSGSPNSPDRSHAPKVTKSP